MSQTLVPSEVQDILEENSALKKCLYDLNIYLVELEREIRVLSDELKMWKSNKSLSYINHLDE